MQSHVTIELLVGSITNDVLYIHHGQDTIAHGKELADLVLALPIARLSWEPRLQHGQVLTQPKLGDGHGQSGPKENAICGHLHDSWRHGAEAVR